MTKVLLIILGSIILNIIPAYSQTFNVEPAYDISDLGWLEGSWRGELEGNRFEAYYTSALGGQIISVSKEYLPDSTCFIEFERFQMRDGKIMLTPYPDGNKSVSFTLTNMDLNNFRAVFTNPEHDFPNEIRYHRLAEDSLQIDVLGSSPTGSIGFTLLLAGGKQASEK